MFPSSVAHSLWGSQDLMKTDAREAGKRESGIVAFRLKGKSNGSVST